MVWISLLILIFSMPTEAREPSIHEVQQVAVHSMGFDRREMEGWKRRSRWAAALPKLQAGFQRDLKDLVSLSTRDSVSVSDGTVNVGPTQNNFDQNFNQGTGFDIKAIWSLNELVFSRDSLAVSSERLDWFREKERVLQGVTEAFFTRQRLIKEEGRRFLLDQANATLDAYTDGWFSGEVAQEIKR